MADYLDLQFPDAADPQAKKQRFTDVLEANIDGYDAEASEGSPEIVAGEASAEAAADNEAAAQLVARAIWREFGRNLIGLVPVDATYAQALVTITGTTDYTVPEGTQVAIGDQTFLLAEDTVLTGGSAAGARFNAFAAGEAGSNLTGTPQAITALTDVTSYTLDEPTSGGHEAETDAEYETRLRRFLPAAFGRPELAEDFAVRMLLNSEVASALVLDGYNADDDTEENDATTTLIGRNSNGLPISTLAKNERKAFFEANKVSGWEIFVIDATYTTVDVAAEVSIWPGYDEATVLAAVTAAITEFLNPATYGASPAGLTLPGTSERFPDWNQEPEVLRSELTVAINDAHDGVRHLESLTLAAAQDVTAAAGTDLVALTAHGFADTDEIVFTELDGGAPLVNGTTYFVRDSATDNFKVAATSGGSVIDITTDMVSGLAHHPESLADADVALAGVAKLPLPGIITVSAA